MAQQKTSFSKPAVASVSRRANSVEKWIAYRFCDHVHQCTTCVAPFYSVCSTGWTLGLQISSFFFLGPGKVVFSTIKDAGCHARVELSESDRAITVFLSTLQQMSRGSWSTVGDTRDRWQRSIHISQEKHFTALFRYVLGWL
jgi:hypothetical protein